MRYLSDGQLLQELEVVGHLVAGQGEPVVPPGEGIFSKQKRRVYNVRSGKKGMSGLR